MTLMIKDILGAVTGHASATGHFVAVNGHEPKSDPGQGLKAAVWVQRTSAVAAASGLNTVTTRIEFNVRLYQNMIKEPQDAIDPQMMEALDALMAAYCGNFTLGGLVRNVDIKGSHGPALGAEAGYVNQDGKLFRVITVTLPVIVNDLWLETA